MNQAPIDRQLTQRPPEEKTLLAMIQRELWPMVQAILRNLAATGRTTPLDVATDTTIDGTEDFIRVDASAANVLIMLPTPAAWLRHITVMKVDGTANTVTVTSVATGDPVLAGQWDVTTLISEGTAFYEV